MIIYLAYELKRYFIDSILNTLILITGSWAVYRALTIVIDDDRVVGDICIGTTLIVFLSPIQIMYKVFREKNYNLIPVFSAIVYLFTCLFWFLYAIFIKDFYLAFPNVLGIILSSMEIALYINSKRRYPGIGERDTTGTIDIVTGGNEEKKEETPIKMDEQEGKPVQIVNKLDN
jgi:solute carrier family 50 protein (sugar transporter)